MNKYKQLYLKNQLEIENLVNQIRNPFNAIMVESERVKNYKQLLSVRDCIICANRYVWELPINLTSQQLETLFYKYGSLCFFVENGVLIVSRFTKIGELTPYGALQKIQPIDFAGNAYSVCKTVIQPDGKNTNIFDNNVAIVINDYSGVFTDSGVVPRAEINFSTTIKDQSLAYEYMVNDMRASIKKGVAFCDNENQAESVRSQMREVLNPSSPIAVVANDKSEFGKSLDLQTINGKYDGSNYTQVISFYDKTRLNFDGISTGDLSEKKERKISAEVENADEHTMYVYEDGLQQRKNGVELIKKYLKFDGVEKISVRSSKIIEEKEVEKMENIENVSVEPAV